MLFQKGHTINNNRIPWNKNKKLDRIKFPIMGHFQKHSLKSKEKISKANLGKISWNKGIKGIMQAWNKDKKWPEMTGKNNPNWKGGFNRKEYMKQWKKKNLFKSRIYVYNRKLLTKSLTLDIVQQVYEDNIKQYGTLTCYLCLKPIPFGKDHLEHKIPLSRGGNNKRENLDIACQICNLKKHTKTEIEYRMEIPLQ
jgi:5-methylcytosine-specific restriction endonuclease McrA